MTLLRTGLALLLLFALAHPAVAAVPRLRCPDDSLFFFTSTERYGTSLAQMGERDTSRAVTEARLWIASRVDTLEVPFAYTPFEVELVGRTRTVREFVWHHAEKPDEDKLALLRERGAFRATDRDPLPGFRYANPTDDSLAALEQRYGLSRIAGDGDEFTRARNLMRWVHRTVRHDGNRPNPAPMLSGVLLAACENGRGTSNCRGLATILNDALLATGFTARHLTCLPADSTDPDCHVVNMVFLEREQRWVYIDPTHDAWFEDAHGRVLGPLEIRAALAAGDSLVIGGGLDWNGEAVSRAHYRNYMTKNFYRFSCPAESRYGAEEQGVGQVYLAPTDDGRARLGAAGVISRRGWTERHTDDPARFFAKPKREAPRARS